MQYKYRKKTTCCQVFFRSIKNSLDKMADFYYICIVRSGVEQLVARRAHNPKVVGSSPAPATKISAFPQILFFLLIREQFKEFPFLLLKKVQNSLLLKLLTVYVLHKIRLQNKIAACDLPFYIHF